MSTAPVINYNVADVTKKCKVCGSVFTELNNTGRWLCRQHPGDIVNNRFTCCNLITIYPNKEQFYDKTISLQKKGCERCDHRTTLETFTDMSDGLVEVPLVVAPKLNCNMQAIRVERLPRGDVRVFVYRYDIKKHNQNEFIMTADGLARRNMIDPSFFIGNKILYQ